MVMGLCCCVSIAIQELNGLRSALCKGFLNWFRCRHADILYLYELKAKPHQIEHSLFHAPGSNSLPELCGIAQLPAGNTNRVIAFLPLPYRHPLSGTKIHRLMARDIDTKTRIFEHR